MLQRAALLAWALFPLGLLAAAPVLAEAPLDRAAIEAKVHAGDRAPADAYRETDVTVYSNGTKVVEHDVRQGKDFRYVYDAGPIHSERGRLNGQAWYMNENGQVVLDDPDDAKPGPREPVKPTVAAIHTPVEGYLIAALDSRGHGLKEYIDGTSWIIVRGEAITADGTLVSTFDDVRSDHGRTFAHHVRSDDQAAKLSSDTNIVSYEPGSVPASGLAIPSPRRALVTFPAGVTSVELPAKFVGTQVIVRLMVGTRGLDFTLDTGASGIAIDAQVARELGLQQYFQHSEVTARRYDAAEAIIPEVKVGSLTMRDVNVSVVPQGWELAPGVKTVGLLGFDFLAELGVTIDYEHRRVTVVPGSRFEPPTDQRAIPIDVRIGSGTPHTDVLVNGQKGERFVLDTGAGGTFLLMDYFARHHPEAFADQTNDKAPIVMEGIGGAFQVKRYSIAKLQLANVVFENFHGYRVITKGAYESGEDDGVIGAVFLMMFTVSLDYGNSRVYLVPNIAGRLFMGLPREASSH